MNPYIKLAIAALLPAIAAAVLYVLDHYTPFGKCRYAVKQIIFGIIFGGLAIVGTEWGIPIRGAQMNCRDAAVLTAGLLFGGPAGIIAGVIGAVERWLAVAWGIGSFTRLACSLSTLIAGFYSAALRKWMFEDKRPGLFLSLAVGCVMEVFHMTMVFLTNMATPEQAMEVVKNCSDVMIVSNGLSVMLATLAVMLISRSRSKHEEKKKVRISQTIQRWLLLMVVLAFAVTTFFVFGLQDRLAISQCDTLLSLAIDETAEDIEDASDENILRVAKALHYDLEELNPTPEELQEYCEWFDIAEINMVNEKGLIVYSSEPSFIGFDMASGEQSSAFLCLLGDTEDYVQAYGPIAKDPSIQRKYAGVKSSHGLIQIGYNANQFQRDIDEEIIGITKNRHVGQNGYILIIDGEAKLVSAPSWLTDAVLKEAGAEIGPVDPNTTVRLFINNQEVYARYRLAEGYAVMSVLPVEEALQMRNIALYVNTFMEVLVFAVMFALIYLLIKRVVVNRIKRVNRSLSNITAGNLDEVVNVRSNREFEALSDDINATVDTLKRYIAEASARIDEELEFAKNIQASALPNKFPAFPKRKDFDIYALMNPAKEVGGDFYDFYMTGEDNLHFLVADVSGKGIPAAMFMMRAKTELKSLTEAAMPIDEVFTSGNRALCEGNDAGMFVTAWQGSIDLMTGLVRFANAGHNPPLVRHADGKFEFLRSRAGFVLAGMDGIQYKEQQLQLMPGDILYLYTDGVTEATNAASELYGEERLQQALNSRDFDSMQELCAFVKSEVEAFVAEAPQFDDITMVALRFLGQPPVPTVAFEKASIQDIPAVTEFIEGELEKLDCPMKTVVQINIAIDEIYSNIVKYAYPKEPGPVNVQFVTKNDPARVFIRFEDEGIPYNPLKKDDPDITLSAEERAIGGLGVYMVKKTMDDMRYKYENGRNVLTIQKNL